MDEVWPEAQAHVARELGSGDPTAIVFSSEHARLPHPAHHCSARARRWTASNPDHRRRVPQRSAAVRAMGRKPAGSRSSELPAEPFNSFLRAISRPRPRPAATISFSSAKSCSEAVVSSSRVGELASMAQPDGPWVVIDGYHAFMAIEQPLGVESARSAFYLGGGYKYAMAGEGCAFLHAPVGFGPRPPVTGWFAEFEDLSLPPGSIGYAPDASRFIGATFDPVGPLPLQRGAADACRQRPYDHSNVRFRRRSSAAIARSSRRHCAWRNRIAEPARGVAARALPRISHLRAHSAGTRI